MSAHAHVFFTSLALLAFFSEGSTSRKGKYKENIKKGIKFLLESSGKDGRITHGLRYHFEPLQTAMGMVALLEGYLKSSDKDLKTRIKMKVIRAIKYLKKSARKGAWGYNDKTFARDHVGMTYCILSSLATARKCGFKIKENVFKKTIKYLRRRIHRDGKVEYSSKLPSLGWRYRPGGVLLALGKSDAKDLKEYKSVKKLFTSIKPEKLFREKNYHPFANPRTLYRFFFATIAAKTIGEKFWKGWFTSARDLLLRSQLKSGEWPKDYKYGDLLSCEKLVLKAMATPVALLILQLPLDNLSFASP
jgi:hypothetical protein